MRRSNLVLCLALLGACACARQPSRARWQPPAFSPVNPVPTASAPLPAASTSTNQERYVLVRFGAALYSKPEANALVQAERAGERSFEMPEPFRFVAEQGGFVQVESLGENAWDHCSFALWFAGLRVRLFVARDDIVSAITRPTTVSWPNGTSIALVPGVPVGASTGLGARGGEVRPVSADGFRFFLELPRDAVAMTYALGTQFRVAEQPSHVRRDAQMLFGDGLGPGVRPTAPAAPEDSGGVLSIGGPEPELVVGSIEKPSANTYVYAVSDHPAGRRVELRSRCAKLELAVAPEAIVTGRLPGAVSLERTPPRLIEPDHWRAPAGTSVYFPDGSVAGSVSAAIPLRGEGELSGARRCFRTVRGDFNYWGGSPDKPTLKLCFDAAALAVWPEHEADSVAATIGPETRRYVVVGVVNHTHSSNAELLTAVRATLKNQLMLGPGYAIAPANENKARSAAIVGERKLAGFRVEVEVPPLTRSNAKKLPNGSEQSGEAGVRPKLRLYRFPSGELVDQTELSLSRSVWSGESFSDAEVLKESLLDAWSRFRAKMEQ